jgi:hypothetical protein
LRRPSRACVDVTSERGRTAGAHCRGIMAQRRV